MWCRSITSCDEKSTPSELVLCAEVVLGRTSGCFGTLSASSGKVFFMCGIFDDVFVTVGFLSSEALLDIRLLLLLLLLLPELLLES